MARTIGPGAQRLRKIPLGPVAVFGASNFPLAFSTAGTDTASALAAGCPVVAKGHPAHPDTGAMVAKAIGRAVEASGLPAGVFSHVTDPGVEVGQELVRDPRTAAVGFTGSRVGGLALLQITQSRPVPIPVYGEMSSVNPVLLLPAALRSRGAELGRAFAASLTIGAGQFCTNPGLIVCIEGPGLDDFIAAASAQVRASVAAQMLSSGIHAAYERDVAELASRPDIETLARGREGTGHADGIPGLFSTNASTYLADATLANEVFGAAPALGAIKSNYAAMPCVALAERTR